MSIDSEVVLTIKTIKGDLDVTPSMFSTVNFNGTMVVSGEKYYIDKAVSLGSLAKPKPKK